MDVQPDVKWVVIIIITITHSLPYFGKNCTIILKAIHLFTMN